MNRYYAPPAMLTLGRVGLGRKTTALEAAERSLAMWILHRRFGLTRVEIGRWVGLTGTRLREIEYRAEQAERTPHPIQPERFAELRALWHRWSRG